MDLVAAAVAKLTALSLPAKATGLGIAVALGATGGVAAYAADQPEADPGVVDVTEAEPTIDPADDADAPDEDADGVVDGDGDDAAEDGEAPERDLPAAAEFGQSVAADARDGGVDGQEIRERAHERNAERRAGTQDGTEDGTEDGDDAGSTVGDDPAPVDPVTTDAAGGPSVGGTDSIGTGRADAAPGQDRRP